MKRKERGSGKEWNLVTVPVKELNISKEKRKKKERGKKEEERGKMKKE